MGHTSSFPARSPVRKIRVGLDAKQSRQKNVEYPRQQEAGISRRERSTLTWTR